MARRVKRMPIGRSGPKPKLKPARRAAVTIVAHLDMWNYNFIFLYMPPLTDVPFPSRR
jgi:hypothetical protein